MYKKGKQSELRKYYQDAGLSSSKRTYILVPLTGGHGIESRECKLQYGKAFSKSCYTQDREAMKERKQSSVLDKRWGWGGGWGLREGFKKNKV